jgi:alkylation response protein AidB-like acyl-CoA dehydrogenase
MDLSYGAENDRFRAEVSAFLDTAWRPPRNCPAEYIKTFREHAVEHGYLYRRVPKRYGGSEQPVDVLKAQIIREEFGRRRAPMEVVGNGTNIVVPTLLEWGTEEQRELFIRPTLAGEVEWAQGYSEPSAGSDLASLTARGELKGDTWIINGHKIWTTRAAISRYMFALIRTEPGTSRHDGITYLLLDLHQPGVTIRPLKQMTGDSEFAEVILDNVRTPLSWMVGVRGQGWRVSKSTLKHERAAIGSSDRVQALFKKIVDLASEPGSDGVAPIQYGDVQQRLAELEGWVMSHRASAWRQLSLSAAGTEAGLVGMVEKLLTTTIGESTARLAQDLIGEAALLFPARPGSGRRGHEKWLDQIKGALGNAIAGGTSNIHRNIIAERGLGLPRESDNGEH